ncbi:AN1-type zinc finger protein 2A-like [Paramacrobiotus metropolitanus]|uniref:AN1-type zinc finger protein 2A-like n=1 Tax=Paramacrobiotus metropolitanus TaxID=2943436 RepID=UPI002445751C|nr:AN1-type zinc finger protein 2A-like [Paramacrobiotus metropolitanus]
MYGKGEQSGGGGSGARQNRSGSNSPDLDLRQHDAFHVGAHCEENTCNRLDFLPVKCDGCGKTFCKEHYRYEHHQCSSGRQQDNQVPVCPLCNAPVPIKRGQLPDLVVSEHLDTECRSEKALTLQARKRQAGQVYAHGCAVPGCKRKEMLKVDCPHCRRSFCLAHRFPDDHQCANKALPLDNSAKRSAPASKAGAAALARFGTSSKATPAAGKPGVATAVQSPNMSEDEALARALQLSLSDSPSGTAPAPTAQEDDDLELARALAVSEAEFQRVQTQQSRKTNCVMS